MFVTALTESPIPRPTHLSDVAELAFELRQCQVFHINSKTFDGEKDGHVFWTDDVGLGSYYNGNLEILKLERLCRDYIATNQSPKEDGNEEPDFIPLASLPDLAGSSSLTMNSRYASPPRIGLYCDKYKNPES